MFDSWLQDNFTQGDIDSLENRADGMGYSSLEGYVLSLLENELEDIYNEEHDEENDYDGDNNDDD
jgi:hypothetical protein